jgi:hypothetical protein
MKPIKAKPCVSSWLGSSHLLHKKYISSYQASFFTFASSKKASFLCSACSTVKKQKARWNSR